MVKAEWGSRRICYKCGARFYDLKKEPALCPKCGADQAKAPPKMSAGSPARARVRAVLPEEVADVDDRPDEDFEEIEEIGIEEIEPAEAPEDEI